MSITAGEITVVFFVGVGYLWAITTILLLILCLIIFFEWAIYFMKRETDRNFPISSWIINNNPYPCKDFVDEIALMYVGGLFWSIVIIGGLGCIPLYGGRLFFDVKALKEKQNGIKPQSADISRRYS